MPVFANKLCAMRSILITGGTGSLGNALVRRLIDLPTVERIVIFSRDEWKQAEMAERYPPYGKVRYMIGDVRDERRLGQAMFRVDTVIHAAALKRVDSVAYNPHEVIKTNVEGTVNVIQAAMGQAEKVMVISSDKAVEPTNIYGASKMMAEQYAVSSNSYAYPRGTRVSVCRYGNVLASRGSMYYVFRDFIERGEAVPLTHPKCTRFLITLNDAVYFVLASIVKMVGGEIFVPRLKSVRIVDFIEAMGSTNFVVTGMRAGGEKLHESMIGRTEAHRAIADNGLAYTIKPELHPWTADDMAGKPFEGDGFNSEDNEFYSVAEIKDILDNERLGFSL